MEGRSFDNESIYDLYSRTHSICSEDFYGSAKSELLPISGQSESISKWDTELIPKIKKYENAHYLCPKCLQFPLIDIISKEIILYECKCKNREKKALNIKKLFNKDNEYMTFIENNNFYPSL